ncbi:MAG: hypothetical protein J5684_02340, partial [Eubacterium sp.]|nr:hypothetical protein [Eubacterium sp.]
MRRKTAKKCIISIGMIMAMSAAMCGCSGESADRPKEHTTVEETTTEEETTEEKTTEEKKTESSDKKEDKKEDSKKDDKDESKSDDDSKKVKKVGKREDSEDKADREDSDDKADSKVVVKTKKVSSEGSSEVTKAEAKPAENVAENPDVKHQINVITTANGEWYHPDDTSLKYMVSDLDHDGHFEIISAKTEGTMGNTLLNIWEVNEDNNGLVGIQLPASEGPGYVPEINVDGGYITFSNDSEYLYIASDYSNGGASDPDHETITSFKLNGTSLEINPIAIKST